MGGTDDEVIGVVDGQVAVNPVMCLDSVVNIVLICTEDRTSITVLGDLFISIQKILSNEERFIAQDFDTAVVEVQPNLVAGLPEVGSVDQFDRVGIIGLADGLGVLLNWACEPAWGVTTIPRFGPP